MKSALPRLAFALGLALVGFGAIAAEFAFPPQVATPGLTVTGQGPGKFGPTPPQVFSLPSHVETPGLRITGQGPGKFGPSPPASFSLPAQVTTSGLTVTGNGPKAPSAAKALR